MNCKWLTSTPPLYRINEDYGMLLQDCIFQDTDGTLHTTPRGLIGDGASEPSILDVIWDPFQQITLRSVFQHDVEYIRHDIDKTFIFPRDQVDKRFVRAMRVEISDNPPKGFRFATLWYSGVRIFGQHLWDKPSATEDDIKWFEAYKSGPEALDKWIADIIQKPSKLYTVKYANEIKQQKLRRSRTIVNDLKNLQYYIFNKN